MSKGDTANNIGVLLIGVAACIGAVAYMNKSDGRYELVQLGTMRLDQFLLDKGSGRIWQYVCMGEPTGAACKGRMLWEEMFVSSLTPQDSPAMSDFKNFVNEQEKKSKK